MLERAGEDDGLAGERSLRRDRAGRGKDWTQIGRAKTREESLLLRLLEKFVHAARYDPADARDVEAATPDEMRDALPGLRRAHGIRAAVGDFAFEVLDRAVAHRAPRRHLELGIALPLFTRVDLDPHHLGDDVTGALDDHAVP